MDLLDSATRLYGLVPEEFTATRNALAKTARSDGDKELADDVRKLRKPSMAAWTVNQLARHHLDELEQVVDLGAALREAQESRDADELRELNHRRQELLGAVARQGRALARELGHPVGEAVATEVEQTLRAAMTDPSAGAAVLSGRLVSGLESTGLAPVDVSDAVAVPSALPAGERRRTQQESPAQQARGKTGREKDEKSGRAARAARDKAEAAERAASEADDRLAAMQRQVDEATSAREDLADEVKRRRRDLQRAEKQVRDADRALSTAEGQRDQAERTAEKAHRTADQARARAERMG